MFAVVVNVVIVVRIDFFNLRIYNYRLYPFYFVSATQVLRRLMSVQNLLYHVTNKASYMKYLILFFTLQDNLTYQSIVVFTNGNLHINTTHSSIYEVVVPGGIHGITNAYKSMKVQHGTYVSLMTLQHNNVLMNTQQQLVSAAFR